MHVCGKVLRGKNRKNTHYVYTHMWSTNTIIVFKPNIPFSYILMLMNIKGFFKSTYYIHYYGPTTQIFFIWMKGIQKLRYESSFINYKNYVKAFYFVKTEII